MRMMWTEIMRTHTAEDLAEDLILLDLYEVGGLTQYALAGMVGLDQGHVSRRLARARRYRQELRRREDRQVAEDNRDDPLDVATIVELIDSRDPSARPRGEWIDLESGVCSIVGDDRVAVGIGIGVQGDKGRSQRCPAQALEGQRLSIRRLESGRKAEEEIKQHQPDPDGLKGGVG